MQTLLSRTLHCMPDMSKVLFFNAGHAEGPDWTVRHRQDTVDQSSSS